MIWAFVGVAVVAQVLDIASWALMPVGRVAESNQIVLVLGPRLALDAKATIVFIAATWIADFWWWRPRIAYLLSAAMVAAGSVGTLSNLPR